MAAFAAALLGVVLGQLAPGPNFLAVASAALRGGRGEAFVVALGVAVGILVWVTLSIVGLGALLTVRPELAGVLKLIGGAYLIYLAARAVREAMRPPAHDDRFVSPARAAAFRRGLLVNLTNPKAALMWAAVSTFLLGSGVSTTGALLFAPLACLSGLTVYGGYALVFSAGPVRSAYARLARLFEALFGLAFGAIGGALVVDGLRQTAR